MYNSEQCLLGCILLDYKKVIHKTVILNTDDFLNPIHKTIFDAIIKLDLQKKDIDSETVIETIGPGADTAYIRGIADLMPTTAHIDTYIWQVKAISKNKRLLEGVEKIAREARESGDTEKMLYDLQLFNNDNIQTDIDDCMSIKDLMFEIYPEIRDGREMGLKTGFDKLDRNLHGFFPQNMIVLASGAGKGKTALALDICVNMIQDGKNILFYSFEMSKHEIGKRLLAIDCEIPSEMSDKLLKASQAYFGKDDYRRDRQGKLSALSFDVIDRVYSLNGIVADARARITEKKRQGSPYDLIVIDYLQLIIPNNPKDNRERQVAEIAYGIKELIAKTLNTPVLAVAQVNRLADKEKGREYEIYDLRESGAIEQAADVILFLNHARKTLDVERGLFEEKYSLSCKKARHGKKDWFVLLDYYADITKFKEKPEINKYEK